jgi:hypothetical protein
MIFLQTERAPLYKIWKPLQLYKFLIDIYNKNSSFPFMIIIYFYTIKDIILKICVLLL